VLTTWLLLTALPAVQPPASTLPGAAQEQTLPPHPPDQPQAYVLLCRGGGPFGFDTLRQMDSVPIIEVALGFRPATIAGGPDGTALDRGTCAWVDRPLNAQEPSLIWFTQPLTGMLGPQDALNDPDRYWHFMVFNTGRGHLQSVGHGAWTSAPATGAPPRFPSRFAYLAAFMLVAWIPGTWVLGWLSAWRRLAQRYPAAPVLPGRRIRCHFLVMGRSTYKSMASLIADSGHLHFSMGFLFRPGYPTLSIPWSDITASRDEWRWSLPAAPVVRLTLRRDPEVRVLIRPRVAEEVMAASGGRLRLDERAT
jgi:hypothetical protein